MLSEISISSPITPLGKPIIWHDFCWKIAEFAWSAFTLVASFAVQCVRLFLDSLPTLYTTLVWIPGRCGGEHIVQDGCKILEGIRICYNERYGPHPRETVHTIHPNATSKNASCPPTSAVLYVHGGGWVAANATLLLPSMTPFGRKGCTVFCINYPLFPDRFPIPLISVLRALSWLRSAKGITSVCMIGDSAGGNLVTMAAALSTNSKLLDEFCSIFFEKDEDNYMSIWVFPEICGVVSAYGMLDRNSWKKGVSTVSRLESWLLTVVIETCFRLYISYSAEEVVPFGATLFDLLDKIQKFPPTLLIVGDCDPLVHSSVLIHQSLDERNFSCELGIFNARHAFVGLPPAFSLNWKSHGLPATQQISSFIARCHALQNEKSASNDFVDKCC